MYEAGPFLCSERVPGGGFCAGNSTENGTSAWNFAKKETILHSDQGCHYTCIKFIQLVKNSSLRQSMSRKGNCWDNAPQESFFGHMKDELAQKIPNWTCFADVQRSIDDWMDYYNNDRYQWDLAKLSPNEYYRYLTIGSYPC